MSRATATVIRAGMVLTTWLAAMAFPRSLGAQVDQAVLARAMRGEDDRAASEAYWQARRTLAPEEMGAELRAALIGALERQNRAYRATFEVARARETSQVPSPEADRLAGAFWGEGYGFLFETVVGLEDPSAIPALAGALFSEGSSALAAFGEDAAPSVLLVAEGQAWDRAQVEGALETLTWMLEEPKGKPLSEATLDRARRLVRSLMTSEVPYPEMVVDRPFLRASGLRAAISLALALQDPLLRDLVAELSRSPEAIRRAGIEDPDLIEEVRRSAAEALARRVPGGS